VRIGLALALLLAAAPAACSSRIVAPLRPEPIPLAPEEPFRATPPDASPVAADVALPLRVTRLPNGLRVVHVERRALPIVAVRLVVERGAADAGGPPEAVTLLTRLCRAATRSKGRTELSRSWAALGARHYVASDADGFELGATAAAADLDAAVALVAEAAIEPRLTPDTLAEVRDEWLADLAVTHSRTDAVLQRNVLAALFGREHAYGYRRHAEREVRAFGVAELQALHARIFQPAQATLIVVGDAPAELVDAVAARRLGGWAAAGTPLPRSAAAPPTVRGARVIHYRRPRTEEVTVAINARGPGAGEPDLIALTVLARAIGGLSSRLRGDIREDRGAAYSIGASVGVRRLASLVTLGAALAEDKAIPALRAMLASLAEARAQGVPERALERAKTSLYAEWRTSVSSTEGLASALSEALGMGLPPDEVARFPARVAAVTADDVRRVARRYLAEDALLVVAIARPKLGADLATLGLGPVATRDGWADPAR